MAALIVTALLFFAVGVALLVRAVALPRFRVSEQVRHIRAYGFGGNGVVQPEDEQFSLGVQLDRVAEDIGRLVRDMLPSIAPLTRGQLAAGGVKRLSPEAFHGYRATAAVVLPTLLLLETFATHGLTALTLLLVVLLAWVVWELPASVIRRRGRARLDRIDRDLPEMVDVLIATVESGMGFAGSLQIVCERLDGPLGDEMRLTLQEQSMGLTTNRALGNLLERCETPSMRAFVRAVQQGQELGVSIGQMLRNVASETRQRRRQAAHEKVQKAPVKLLFPLIFMIFPSLLLVILFPAVRNLVAQLGG